MVKFAVEFWWKMLLTISPAKEARKSPSKLRRKFATNFAENFANFTLEIAGAYITHLKFLLPGIFYAIPWARPGYLGSCLTYCRDSLADDLRHLPSPGPGYLNNRLRNIFESRALSSGAWRGAPDGVAALEVRKGALALWIKGLEHLEKWSKVVAPSGAPPEELYDTCGIS